MVAETGSSENGSSWINYKCVLLLPKSEISATCAGAGGNELKVTRFGLKIELYVTCKEQIVATDFDNGITRNHSVAAYVICLSTHNRCRMRLKCLNIHTRLLLSTWPFTRPVNLDGYGKSYVDKAQQLAYMRLGCPESTDENKGRIKTIW